MLNKRPVFLNCFGGGGSTMLVNLLISHPNVCLSAGETHNVFKPGTRFDSGWRGIKKRILYDYPIRILAGQDVFGRRVLKERKPISSSLQRYIDRILYNCRFEVMVESHNLYKAEGAEYTREELANCRLLTKGLDGVVYTVNIFREMYPDAVFLALVRNGLAACEGRTRRGGSAERFGHVYSAVVKKMLALAGEMPNYHVLRYEEMVSQPIEFMRKVYGLVGLDPAEVPKVRLESRPVTDRQGARVILKGSQRRVYWYGLDDLRGYIRSDINENQIRQLLPADREKFLSLARKTMEQLGYPVD